MNIVFGTIMAIIGAYFLISGLAAQLFKKSLPPYKWLAAKSSLLWKSWTHCFYIVVGAILMTLGILWACGVIFV